MVRPAQYRQSKFIAKIDPDIIKQRIEAEKEFMIEQTIPIFKTQEQMEIAVGKLLSDKGLYGIQIHHYRNFSQELFSLTRRFWTNTLNKEATLLAKKWIARGLDKETLKEIAKLFNITLDLP